MVQNTVRQGTSARIEGAGQQNGDRRGSEQPSDSAAAMPCDIDWRHQRDEQDTAHRARESQRIPQSPDSEPDRVPQAESRRAFPAILRSRPRHFRWCGNPFPGLLHGGRRWCGNPFPHPLRRGILSPPRPPLRFNAPGSATLIHKASIPASPDTVKASPITDHRLPITSYLVLPDASFEYALSTPLLFMAVTT